MNQMTQPTMSQASSHSKVKSPVKNAATMMPKKINNTTKQPMAISLADSRTGRYRPNRTQRRRDGDAVGPSTRQHIGRSATSVRLVIEIRGGPAWRLRGPAPLRRAVLDSTAVTTTYASGSDHVGELMREFTDERISFTGPVTCLVEAYAAAATVDRLQLLAAHLWAAVVDPDRDNWVRMWCRPTARYRGPLLVPNSHAAISQPTSRTHTARALRHPDRRLNLHRLDVGVTPARTTRAGG
jgi:hypothetical protein